MNKEETLALYAQGKEAWNAWAADLLACREDSQAWKDAAKADFSRHCFESDADFLWFIFPGEALFTGVRFSGEVTNFGAADFRGRTAFTGAVFNGHAVITGTFHDSLVFNDAKFLGRADFPGLCLVDDKDPLLDRAFVFNNAIFKQDVSFSGATFPSSRVMFRRALFEGQADFMDSSFNGIALFDWAIFKDRAMFYEATFNSSVQFIEAAFEGDASFDGATFHNGASFNAVQVKSRFTMSGTKFREVPDFQQATFVGAPRLDTAKIEPQHTRNISFAAVKTFFKGDLEKEGRWRTLRRLAEQGKDHVSERRFFKEEVIARRGVTDKWWSAPFWFGVFYQLFSNFGLSLSRPLIAWLMVLSGFACIYAYGSDGPWQPAFLLSLHKSLPALSSVSGGLPGLYARLYGVASCEPFRPIIPDSVAVLGITQTLFSAVMIFLFLLAVRNRFRVK